MVGMRRFALLRKKHFGINVGTDTGLMFPDFSQIAAAHDIAHLTVSTESELDAVNAVKAKHNKFIVEIMADHNSVLEPKCSVAIAGDKFGTSQLEHLDPPFAAGEVDRFSCSDGSVIADGGNIDCIASRCKRGTENPPTYDLSPPPRAAQAFGDLPESEIATSPQLYQCQNCGLVFLNAACFLL